MTFVWINACAGLSDPGAAYWALPFERGYVAAPGRGRDGQGLTTRGAGGGSATGFGSGGGASGDAFWWQPGRGRGGDAATVTTSATAGGGDAPLVVPLPATLPMFLGAMAALWLIARRRQTRRSAYSDIASTRLISVMPRPDCADHSLKAA